MAQSLVLQSLAQSLDDCAGGPVGTRLAHAVFRAVLIAAALGLLSAPAQGAAGRVDAREAVLALAHLARVGQADGRPAADVAVGAAPAEEALAGGHVRHAVGPVGGVLALLAGRALDVGARLAAAHGAGGRVLAELALLALERFAGGRLGDAHLAHLHLAHLVNAALFAARLRRVPGGLFAELCATGGGGGGGERDQESGAAEHGSGCCGSGRETVRKAVGAAEAAVELARLPTAARRLYTGRRARGGTGL